MGFLALAYMPSHVAMQDTSLFQRKLINLECFNLHGSCGNVSRLGIRLAKIYHALPFVSTSIFHTNLL